VWPRWSNVHERHAGTAPVNGDTVVVVGLGVMGRGIARLFAGAGFTVVATDADADRTRSGLEELVREAADADRPVGVAALSDGVRADLVIEAVSEDIDVKRAALAQVAGSIGPDTMVATNTSSLSVDALAAHSDRPDHVLGLHFFNPPTRMQLVEVVVGSRTDPAVVDRAVAWVEQVGRTPVRCVDSPGFIVNRACRPLYMEAQLLVEQGVAPATVDVLARRALGHRMGPLETLDLAGLHVHVAACESAWRALGEPRYAPSSVARRLVGAGHTGRAAGHGFYDHAAGRPSAQQAPLLSQPGQAPRRLDVLGPGAADLPRHAVGPGSGTGLALWRDAGASTNDDVAAVRCLVAAGREVVVDSSDSRWLTDLPAGASWIHLHHRDGHAVAEVVDDERAGVRPGPAVDDVLAAVGADAVRVPAMAGLVVDRMWSGLVNEATLLVEQAIASPSDIDTALRLGMGHPAGPFEVLDEIGAPRALATLDMLADRTRDPRYRATALLRRLAAATQRQGQA
jgi:3-hydroxybutyryl-CoA dehydrogenase